MDHDANEVEHGSGLGAFLERGGKPHCLTYRTLPYPTLPYPILPYPPNPTERAREREICVSVIRERERKGGRWKVGVGEG